MSAAPDLEETGGHLVLPSATTLTVEGASQRMRQNPSRLVALIGPFDAGKTSLIASLYDLFQSDEVSGVGFAKSDTLHGFELACHDARAASRRNTPSINRTPRGEVRFYHLDLGGGPAGTRLTLLLGDRAGEEYGDVADDISLAGGFPEILRADVLTLLVDGARLLDDGARHNARSEVRLMLQAFAEGGALDRRKHLAIVQTKQDLVEKSGIKERVTGDLVRIVEDIGRDLPGQFQRTSVFRVAASPADDILPRGYGIATLLDFWLTAYAERVALQGAAAPVASRAFGRLAAVTT